MSLIIRNRKYFILVPRCLSNLNNSPSSRGPARSKKRVKRLVNIPSPKNSSPPKYLFLKIGILLLHHLNMSSSNACRLQTADFKTQNRIEKALPKNTKKAYWPKQDEWRVSGAIRMARFPVKRPLPCNPCPTSFQTVFSLVSVADTCATYRHSAKNRNGRMVSSSPKRSASSSSGYREKDR